jgi:IS30 family transposase
MAERLSELERRRIAELAVQGWTTRLIGKEIGRGRDAVARHPVPLALSCCLR